MTALKVIVLLLLGALAAGTTAVTGQMARLEQGLTRNVAAAETLVRVQESLLDRSRTVEELLAAAERMGGGMAALAEQGRVMEAQVGAITKANQATLRLNKALAASGEQTSAQLAQLAGALAELADLSEQMQRYLQQLQGLMAEDAGLMRQMLHGTAQVNARLPEWLAP